MQSIYVPKYDIHYRINPKNPCELQWSKKPFGPMTAWQKAFTFTKPIRALDIDDDTKQGVVVLNDSSTYVGSGVRVWGRKYYTAGSRLYSLYAIGESKMKKMKITVHESKMSAGMARSILNGSVEGDKEDARKNLNRLYSEWVVRFKTKDGKPYTMKISGAEDEADAWKQAVAYAERNGNGDKIDKTAPLSIDYIQKWESVKKTSLKIRVHEKITDDGVIHNVPLHKRAIKDMLKDMHDEYDTENKYNPNDPIVVNDYLHDTAIVTVEWVLTHLGEDKKDKIAELQKQGMSNVDIATELDLLGYDPVLWCYEDKDGTLANVVWRHWVE
ncbi:MAG: hypothetical protein IKT27_05520 [Clostridia bacterium]|nr:hypothetical protein [Clostridia bacterium]